LIWRAVLSWVSLNLQVLVASFAGLLAGF